MKKHLYGHLAVGLLAVALILLGGQPTSAWTGGGGFRGGFPGGGFHRMGFHHGGFHDGFFHHGFHHRHPFFFHHRCCFGSRVFVGVGIGAPLFYPYAYPYPVYSPPAVVEAAPPVYVQSEQQYWYYCRSAQGYYPYVKECPDGWLQVVPQPSPPPSPR
jgi:hypothetical protein